MSWPTGATANERKPCSPVRSPFSKTPATTAGRRTFSRSCLTSHRISASARRRPSACTRRSRAHGGWMASVEPAISRSWRVSGTAVHSLAEMEALGEEALTEGRDLDDDASVLDATTALGYVALARGEYADRGRPVRRGAAADQVSDLGHDIGGMRPRDRQTSPWRPASRRVRSLSTHCPMPARWASHGSASRLSRRLPTGWAPLDSRSRR